MPPNPTGCCGTLTCCCPDPIPDILTAAFYSNRTDPDDCTTGMNEGSFALTNRGGMWSGTGIVAGQAASLTMECVDFGGGNCYLAVVFDCGSGGQGLTQQSLACDPFEYISVDAAACGPELCLIVSE